MEVVTNSNHYKLNKLIGATPLRKYTPVQNWERRMCLQKYNAELLNQCRVAKPDVFFVFNESLLFPTTIQAIKEQCKCLMVCCIGDDPWDSVRWVADFPHSLKYFDLIFCADPVWELNIRKVVPHANIFWHYGGYDPEVFHPVPDVEISEADIARLGCQISFTGSAYGSKAEGAYRADILSFVANYDLKIWGGDNWQYRFMYLPELQKCYKGSRLDYKDLTKLYKLSQINMNLPAPQISLTFQPRVFEIAACQGFQIIDNRAKLRDLFADSDIVTFDSAEELKDKVAYYLSHDAERQQMALRLHEKVWGKYTWQHWADDILSKINQSR
ncbi:MAG: glycosyltransferase [Candidatus Cloacimonetes bacterium]|nr:glycosyltransferase [Candidatus Cloacimonadota bacterium]